MMTKKSAVASIALVALTGVTAVMAANESRKGDRFVPRNDDFRASAQRAASQGSSPECCPADINCDGIVNGGDLGLLIADWGQLGGPADINGDGLVNGADLGLLIAAWGDCTG